MTLLGVGNNIQCLQMLKMPGMKQSQFKYRTELTASKAHSFFWTARNGVRIAVEIISTYYLMYNVEQKFTLSG